MAGIRTCNRESQVQRPNHYTTEPPDCVSMCRDRDIQPFIAAVTIFLEADVSLYVLLNSKHCCQK